MMITQREGLVGKEGAPEGSMCWISAGGLVKGFGGNQMVITEREDLVGRLSAARVRKGCWERGLLEIRNNRLRARRRGQVFFKESSEV